jgi:hypothetical protein
MKSFFESTPEEILNQFTENDTFGVKVDSLLYELMPIGQSTPYHDPGDDHVHPYNEDGQHIRAREIGIDIAELGGESLMIAVCQLIDNVLMQAIPDGVKRENWHGVRPGRSLEYAWEMIEHDRGEWRV